MRYQIQHNIQRTIIHLKWDEHHVTKTVKNTCQNNNRDDFFWVLFERMSLRLMFNMHLLLH
jgi:hypothetical protein